MCKLYPATMAKTPPLHQELPPDGRASKPRPVPPHYAIEPAYSGRCSGRGGWIKRRVASVHNRVSAGLNTTHWRRRQRPCAPSVCLRHRGGSSCRRSDAYGRAMEPWRQRGARTLVTRVYSGAILLDTQKTGPSKNQIFLKNIFLVVFRCKTA